MLRVVETVAVVTQSHSRSFGFTPFSMACVTSYWYSKNSIVTMVISRIVSESKRDIGRKSRFLHTFYIAQARNRQTDGKAI